MGGNQWEPLRFLLSSYYFLYANVRFGLLHQLLETYILFGKLPDVLQCCVFRFFCLVHWFSLIVFHFIHLAQKYGTDHLQSRKSTGILHLYYCMFMKTQQFHDLNMY